jgi:hypothetical protein
VNNGEDLHIRLLPAACCLLPAACCLLPAACCLLPAIIMLSRIMSHSSVKIMIFAFLHYGTATPRPIER